MISAKLLPNPSIALRKLMKKISSNPALFGGVIGLLLVGTIFAVVVWFPDLDEALEKNKRFVQGTYFTVFFYGICVYWFREWRRRSAFGFWASISGLFAVHVVCVSLYSVYVQPILVWQWVLLIFAETFVVVFVLDWATRRFGRLNRHASPSSR